MDANGNLTPIVALGGSYAEPGSPLVAEVSRQLEVPIQAAGVRGASLARWSDALLHTAIPEQTGAFLVFEMGGNEGSMVPRGEDVADVHAELCRSGARAAWVLPPIWPEATATGQRRRAMRAAIIASGVPALWHGYEPTIGELTQDGIHLTGNGYERFATEVAPLAYKAVNVKALKRRRRSAIAMGVALFTGLALVGYTQVDR
jgi:hypothetical protein